MPHAIAPCPLRAAVPRPATGTVCARTWRDRPDSSFQVLPIRTPDASSRRRTYIHASIVTIMLFHLDDAGATEVFNAGPDFTPPRVGTRASCRCCNTQQQSRNTRRYSRHERGGQRSARSPPRSGSRPPERHAVRRARVSPQPGRHASQPNGTKQKAAQTSGQRHVDRSFRCVPHSPIAPADRDPKN